MNGHRDKELAEEPEPEVFAEPLIEVLVIMIAFHLYWRGCQDPYSTIATLTSARLTTNYHGLPQSTRLLFVAGDQPKGQQRRGAGCDKCKYFLPLLFHSGPILFDFMQASHIHNLCNFV